jgi:hypothetical protein
VSATIRCPVCTAEVAAEAAACPICGAYLAGELQGYCPRCHAVVAAARDGTCRTCGGPVADLRPRIAQPQALPPAPAPAVEATPPAPAPLLAPAPAPVPAAPAAPAPPAVPAPSGAPAPAPGWPAVPPPPPDTQPATLPGRLVIPGPAPQPVPSSRSIGSRLAIGCGVFVVTVAVLAAALGVLFLATGGVEMLKPVQPVTFDTIGDYPEYRRVVLLGRLDLPGQMHCDDSCGVWLQDPGDPERQVGLFVPVPGYGETAAPNQMNPMPSLYDVEDFKVRLADGSWAGSGDVVRVTGQECRTETKGEVCLRAEMIEAGN